MLSRGRRDFYLPALIEWECGVVHLLVCDLRRVSDFLISRADGVLMFCLRWGTRLCLVILANDAPASEFFLELFRADFFRGRVGWWYF